MLPSCPCPRHPEAEPGSFRVSPGCGLLSPSADFPQGQLGGMKSLSLPLLEDSLSPEKAVTSQEDGPNSRVERLIMDNLQTWKATEMELLQVPPLRCKNSLFKFLDAAP
ncbi:uncharacterized protein [Vicugna pacos]|uniref:Uncharacterized protein isoform X8 n=1 Tax=Vicugna pacos TaxID=30538 RepID=A0ABM5CWZ1_VICPA